MILLNSWFVAYTTNKNQLTCKKSRFLHQLLILVSCGVTSTLEEKLRVKTLTFPISAARMMSEGVPKGWTSLMMSLSDQPLSGSPVINTMLFCQEGTSLITDTVLLVIKPILNKCCLNGTFYYYNEAGYDLSEHTLSDFLQCCY